ncbi:MAG: ergothioneine biosynthesis protein EgtC [Coleofasciculus sp. G3-WIS-01]|uniref:ergothioneine biosynthesis protein EgtC n=1 Tax=Coleofasciculus sp. G3-WIS-01 TaxID=3069528 RepID=UPI0032F8EF3C
MCRLLAYLGSSIQPNRLIYQPEHSLEIQSYKPKETITTSVNADGVGLGWYDAQPDSEPFIYKNILPIWGDINLPHLSRYINSGCCLAYVRSATPGQASNLSNCQPFSCDRVLFIHNGFIENFRDTLYHPIRKHLREDVYRKIEGTTDSEHIFALLANELAVRGTSLPVALTESLRTLTKLATLDTISFSANIVVSDGQQLVASRFARGTSAPSLYWLLKDTTFPNSIIIASEPLFPGKWNPFPDDSILWVGNDLAPTMHQIDSNLRTEKAS